LRENEYAIFGLNSIQSGLIRFAADVSEEADVVIGFTELCPEDHFEFTDINCQNVLEYILPVGKAEHMSFEPYTCRLAIVLVKKGEITLNAFGVLGVECDMSAIRPYEIEDEALRAVYDAAVRTFAHNASDIYMDCPSRERAGWLCDSYFTGMAEYFFFGTCDVEAAFLENFRLYRADGSLPEGALPMCYPSDIKADGQFIPQWDMWYVIEVADYVLKRGHEVERELFRESVLGVLRFLERYENENGMLEDLPSWNFVEWSKANEWTRNVNYPTNFLYVGVLLAAYALYGDEGHKEKALSIREKTKALAFDGEVFVDNAVRDENGKLNNTQNSSEASQYYAMLFGDVNLDEPKYAKLKSHIDDGFRSFAENLGGRDFVPVNAFIGRYLRMQTLLMLEKYEILLENVGTFFSGMAKTTGTLWEYKDGKGSKDHGFASYAAVAIAEALEGLKRKK
jgi:alpha-L-rhamnosidase